MNFDEQRYAGTMLRIAATLLIFLLLTLLRGALSVMLPLLLSDLSAMWAEITQELLLALLYAAAFLLPVWAFAKWPGTVPARMPDLSPSMPRDSLLYVFFGVAVTAAFAFFNARLVDVFHYSEFSNEMLWETQITTNYQLVLMVIGLVIVPAFVEELLFRGVILYNLLPYGRGAAILASAALFGLMHQNAEQLLYATAAGAVLGWIFVQTRSLWPCVLMHFVNNFHSLFQTALLSRLPGEATENALTMLQAVLVVLGLACAVLLFCRKKSAEREETSAAQACALPLSRRVRLFFNVPMIIFVAWCVVNMIFLLIMALAMY